MFLRQSTSQVVRFGPFLDSTDGVTAETALTIAQADMQLSKDGAAFAQKNTTGNATHDTDGWYSTTLDTTDTATVGELYMQVNVSGSIPVWVRWWVIEEAIYDALYGAAATGFNASGLVTLAAVTHTGATIPTVTTLTGHTAQTGDSFARLGAPAGVSVSADVAAVKTDAAAILVDTGTTLDTKINNIQGATFSSATDSLEAIRDRGDAAWTTGAGGSPPQLLQSTTIATLASQTSFTLTAGSADDDAYNGAIVVVTDSATATQKAVGSVSDYTGSTRTVTLSADPGIFTMAVGDTIEIIAALGTGGTPPSVAQIVDGVWDEVLTGGTHNVVNSAGRRLRQIEASFVVTAGTAQTGTANTITLAAGESSTDDIFAGDRVEIVGGTGQGEHGLITAYNGTTKVATMSQNWVITPDATSEYILSPADVDVETWQHVTVSASSTTAKPEVDVSSVSDDATAADNLELDYDGTGYAKANSTIGTCTTNTDMRGTDSAATAAALATVDANVDAVLVDTGTTLPAQITALNNISVADILTTQMTEAYAADGIAPTLAQALFAIQQTVGDFSIAGTTLTVKKLDGSTTAMTFTLDDATNPTSRTRAT